MGLQTEDLEPHAAPSSLHFCSNKLDGKVKHLSIYSAHQRLILPIKIENAMTDLVFLHF